MPVKGSNYILPNRYHALCRDTWRKYKEKYKSDISYNEFVEIIKASNQKIYDIVIDDSQGFKLPENMGYLCVIKYKTKRKAINWADTKKYGKTIYYLNLHSFGYSYHIKWFKTGIARFAFHEAYKFAPLRNMRRDVSNKIKHEEKDYTEWQLRDFWDFSRLERILHKKLKLEEDVANQSG